MSNKRAEIRRSWRSGWKRWMRMSDVTNDRRVVAPPVDWPGNTRAEKRATWRSSWPIWLEESLKQEAKPADKLAA